ncbi:TetR/AcrR family transcriptional regulator [Paludisphaera soli]|uniref:TetR/AcrR family transcriptional regulator n=1 Tax=Paludisphaera soli TaxID=2712865 RepID=UPI0013ED0BEC|nr:TetR/AcrR family transcriptional regulator [Paludisphaera soli]
MPSGRVRQFDADEALERAMEVFWTRGYEGATLDELTAGMGINRPSLYAAFGNKEQLFRKALERYRAGPIGFIREALLRPTARAAAEAVLDGMLRLVCDPANPGGCLAVQAALTSGADAEPIRRELAAGRERAVAAIRERFERARREGELPERTDCAALARFVATVMHGLAVQAAGGADPEELRRAADLAMRAWPTA